jgi:hypothetical protein
LLDARKQWPALKDFRRRKARLLPDDHHPRVLELVRGEPAAGAALFAYFNLTQDMQPIVAGDRPEGPMLFCSESAGYAGGWVNDVCPDKLLPFECRVFGSPSQSS